MNKQKLFSLLSILGLIFVIALIIGFMRNIQTRAPEILDQVALSDEFAGQFNRIISKTREEPIPAVTFVNPEGKRVSWPDFEGQYLLVNFWATWCSPCVLELPSLNKLQKRYEGSNLSVISVSLDLGRSHDEIKQFLDNRNIGQFAAFWDHNQEVKKNIKMRGIPTTYLLNPKGQILHIFEGDANWDASNSHDFFEKLLNRS